MVNEHHSLHALIKSGTPVQLTMKPGTTAPADPLPPPHHPCGVVLPNCTPGSLPAPNTCLLCSSVTKHGRRGAPRTWATPVAVRPRGRGEPAPVAGRSPRRCRAAEPDVRLLVKAREDRRVLGRPSPWAVNRSSMPGKN